ncbi:MAG: WG repeat-containing protein [Candidatus Ozemobacteraceae bacterium]
MWLMEIAGVALVGLLPAVIWWWPLFPLPEDHFIVAGYLLFCVPITITLAIMEMLQLLRHLFGLVPTYFSTWLFKRPVEGRFFALLAFPIDLGYTILHSMIPLLGWWIQWKKAKSLRNDWPWHEPGRLRRFYSLVLSFTLFFGYHLAMKTQPLYPAYGKIGAWGFCSQEGRWIFPPRFEEVRPFMWEFSFAAFRKGPKWGLIDRRGKICQEPVYPTIAFLDLGADTISRYGVPAPEGLKWGFRDKKFQWRIFPVFDDARPFSGERYRCLAAVKQGELWGYIDEAGVMLIEPRYEIAFSFSPGLSGARSKALVRQNGKYLYLFPDGTSSAEDLTGGGPLFPANHGEAAGYAGSDGNFLIPPIYRKGKTFRNGFALVVDQSRNDVLIDSQGIPVIRKGRKDRIWRSADAEKNVEGTPLASTSRELYRIFHGGKWGVFADNRGMIIPAEYDFISLLKDRSGFLVKKGDRYWEIRDNREITEIIRELRLDEAAAEVESVKQK